MRSVIRYQSLTDASVLDAEPNLEIHIVPDKANNTPTIVERRHDQGG